MKRFGFNIFGHMIYFNNDQQHYILFHYPGEQDWMVRKGKTPMRRDQDEQRELYLKLSHLKKDLFECGRDLSR